MLMALLSAGCDTIHNIVEYFRHLIIFYQFGLCVHAKANITEQLITRLGSFKLLFLKGLGYLHLHVKCSYGRFHADSG